MTKYKQKLLYFLAFCLIISLSIILLAPTQKTAFASIIDKAEDISGIPDEELQNLYYIPNGDYFIANPFHRYNDGSNGEKGVCTTVALQLLLGYHNYYSDRRLIPTESSSGLEFLSSDYGELLSSPRIKPDTAYGLGRTALGTSNAVFDEIRRLTPFESIGLDQLLNNATTGANKFIDHYSQTDNKP